VEKLMIYILSNEGKVVGIFSTFNSACRASFDLPTNPPIIITIESINAEIDELVHQETSQCITCIVNMSEKCIFSKDGQSLIYSENMLNDILSDYIAVLTTTIPNEDILRKQLKLTIAGELNDPILVCSLPHSVIKKMVRLIHIIIQIDPLPFVFEDLEVNNDFMQYNNCTLNLTKFTLITNYNLTKYSKKAIMITDIDQVNSSYDKIIFEFSSGEFYLQPNNGGGGGIFIPNDGKFNLMAWLIMD